VLLYVLDVSHDVNDDEDDADDEADYEYEEDDEVEGVANDDIDVDIDDAGDIEWNGAESASALASFDASGEDGDNSAAFAADRSPAYLAKVRRTSRKRKLIRCPTKTFASLRNELERYNPLLGRKPALILANKADVDAATAARNVAKLRAFTDTPVVVGSALQGQNLRAVVEMLHAQILAADAAAAAAAAGEVDSKTFNLRHSARGFAPSPSPADDDELEYESMYNTADDDDASGIAPPASSMRPARDKIAFDSHGFNLGGRVTAPQRRGPRIDAGAAAKRLQMRREAAGKGA
jgi:hypothetical protein